MSKSNALLLVGSIKNEKSSSYFIGKYFLEKLNSSFQKSTCCIYKLIDDNQKLDLLVEEVRKSDLIILSFPLYFDTVPAGVLKAMEYIRDNISKGEQKKNQKIFIISNSGYPEKEQSNVAIKTCEIFAKSIGIEVIGSTAIGAGTTINAKELTQLGYLTKKLRHSIDSVAAEINSGNTINKESLSSGFKLNIPNVIYVTVVQSLFFIMFLQNKAFLKRNDTPYVK